MFPKMDTYNKNSLKKLYNHLNTVVLKKVKILYYEEHIGNSVFRGTDPYMSDKINKYINKHLNKVAICKLMIGELNITLNVYYHNEDIK